MHALVFRTLLESPVPVAIFSWRARADEGWPVEFVSPNVREVLGYEAEDFLSGAVVYSRIIHPDDLERVQREVAEHSASGDRAFEHEDYRIIEPDGRVRWVRDITAIVRGEEGLVTHYFGYILESTARHEALEALATAKREAESATRAKSEFLAMVSHELRTPLTLVMGPVHSLLDGDHGPLSAGATRSLERVRRNAERLHDLVSDLLDFARAEEGRVEVHWESVDARVLVEALVEDASELAEARDIEVTVDSSGVAAPAIVDRMKFERIALNLLDNALKFTPHGGRVDVLLRSDETDGLLLEVADTGPGIPAEDLERIWERFEQADAGLARKHDGVGLGLALVRTFTELMGGAAEVESVVGHGSRFRVRLPRRVDGLVPVLRERWREQTNRRTVPVIDEPAGIGPAATEDRPRVLVADDNAEMRSFVAEILQSAYAVETVEDGVAALAAARRRPPDVILCDVMMPRMDGLEVVRTLKADPALRTIPVVLVTAKAGRRELVGGLGVGADDFLAKPFEPAELRARVDAAARLRRMFVDQAREHAELEVAHAQLHEAQEQLLQTARLAAVGAFIAGISHELNNPLSTILLQAQVLLRRVPEGSPVRSGIVTLKEQAERCRRVMRTILDHARAGRVREVADVAEVVTSVGLLTRSQAQSRGVDLVVRTPPAPLPAGHICVPDIETALLNLVRNAVEATPPGGCVEVAATEREREGRPGVEVTVVDTGGGMTPEVRAHLFEPFFTTKPPGEGTGLGLSLALRLIQASEGTLDVQTSVGQGTTMVVWLPATAGTQRSAA